MRCESCLLVWYDDTICPICDRRTPQEPRYTGWKLVSIWTAVFVASWALLTGIIYLVVQVLS